jgi:hypothetical protein
VREGKGNFEVGVHPGDQREDGEELSAAHLQDAGVSSRTHALSRGLALGLLDELPL